MALKQTRYHLSWLPQQNSVGISSLSNYHGTYINHDVFQYSVSLSSDLLAYHTEVLLLSADQNALVKRLVVRNPTIRQKWHL